MEVWPHYVLCDETERREKGGGERIFDRTLIYEPKDGRDGGKGMTINITEGKRQLMPSEEFMIALELMSKYNSILCVFPVNLHKSIPRQFLESTTNTNDPLQKS